jgi:hypothetical protein
MNHDENEGTKIRIQKVIAHIRVEFLTGRGSGSFATDK